MYTVFCDSRLPPYLFDPVAVLCLCKSVEGNLQVLRICRSILRSHQKSDKDDNCRLTTASRCFGKAPTIARLKRAVVSVGLGPSHLSQLAWGPTGLQRVVVFPDSALGKATIVRRRFYSWKESSSRTQVERQILDCREEGSYGP